MTTSVLTELLRHTTALRAMARELVGDADADDIVQEAVVQSLTAPPRHVGHARSWLRAVVRNLASKHRRAERIRHGHEDRAARTEVAPSERDAEDADTLRRLTEIVTSLPEPYRGTILARYLREQTPNEIAAATGTPVSTVKTRLQRGLELLRQRLEEDGPDWRLGLIAAFALDSNRVRQAPAWSTAMKIALITATLLPLGYVVWGDAIATPATTGPLSAQEASPAPARIESESPTATPPTTPASDTLTASTLPPNSESVTEAVPMIRIDAVGPAAFRDAFRGTNIGYLFASTDGERLWRPLLAPVEQIWKSWDGRGEEFSGARDRVLDYAGRIRWLWMVQPGEGPAPDRWFGVLALETDDSTDLSALAGDLSQALRGFLPGDTTTQTAGGHELEWLATPEGGFVTVPLMIGGSLLAFVGETGALDLAMAQGLRALAADDQPPTAPISMHIDLSQLQRLREMRESPTLARVLGLESLRSLRATVSPVHAHAQFEVEVEFGEGERGLARAFMPVVQQLPDLLARVPIEATPWLTAPFRLDELFRVAVEAAAAERDPDSTEPDLRQSMHDELGFHLDRELLDHLNGEVMVLGDLWQEDDPEVFRRGEDPALGACFALGLEDTEAFRRGFDKLLTHFKGIVHQHEVREVNGVQITRLGTAFYTGAHLAVGQGLAALAFGREGVAQLEALVAEGGAQPSPRPLPEAIERVRPYAPEGWNGLELVQLDALFGGQVTLVLEMLEDSLPPELGFESSPDDTQHVLDQLLPLVIQHELNHLVTMTGHDGSTWRMRVLW